MPEANDMDFGEAEERIRELETVVAWSANLRKPTNLAARVPPEVDCAVRTAVKAVVSAVTESHRIDADPDNDIRPDSTIRVVHYTSIANAIAMLENHSNWRWRMYHTAGFNDKAEGRYLFEGYGLAKAMDIGLMPSDNRQNLPQHDQDQEYHVYAACFVTPRSLPVPSDYRDRPSPDEADSVAFWGAPYGKDGKGVALTVTLKPRSLYRVRYGHGPAQATADAVARYCKCILDTIRTLQSDPIETHTKRIIEEEVTLLRYLYKDQSFEYEHESRAISICLAGDANIEPVLDNDTFNSYYLRDDMSADQLFSSGSSITIGPRVRNRASAMLHIRQLVKRSGLRHICVWASESGYGLSDNR